MTARGRSRAKVILIILGVTLAAGALWAAVLFREARAQTPITHLGALQVNYLVAPDHYAEIGPLGDDFGVAAGGDVFVTSPHGLIEVEPGGAAARVDHDGGAPVDGLAIGGDNSLLTVASGFLGTLDGKGDPVGGVPLPYPGARLAPSITPGSVYLFGRAGAGYRLYRFFESGAFRIVLQADAPIRSVSDTADALFVATDRTVTRVSRGGAKLVFRTPDDAGIGPIVSIAARDNDMLFVATATRVFAVIGGEALSIVNDSGGQLRLAGDNLYVLDQRRGLLYRLSPATHRMFEGAGT